MDRKPIMSPRQRAEKMQNMIEQAGISCGLNLTIQDGEIGFYDQKSGRVVALWKPKYAAPPPYGRSNTKLEYPWESQQKAEVENQGEALTKAEWLEVKAVIQTIGTMLSTSLLAANCENQGQQDFEQCRADFAAAVAAIEYVAEFAADKCRFIPIPEDGQK